MPLKRTQVKRHRQARARFRLLEHREKIYCIDAQQRATLRALRQTCSGTSFQKFNLPPLILVNTWQAQSHYVPGDGKDPAYILLDLQEANRLSHFFKSKHELSPFHSYLDYICFFLDQLCALKDYALARLLLEQFEAWKPWFADEFIRSMADSRREHDLEALATLPALIGDFNEHFLLPYLGGHEFGHHLVSQCPADAIASRSLAHKLFVKPMMKGAFVDTARQEEAELGFQNGKLAWIRGYRAGHSQIVEGLAETKKRERTRRRLDVESFCDFCGLAFAADSMATSANPGSLESYWSSLAESQESLYYLKYLAEHFHPSTSGWVRFFSSDLPRRFITAPYLLAERLKQSPVVMAFGWSGAQKQALLRTLKPARERLQQQFDLLGDIVRHTVLGSLERSLSDGDVQGIVDEHYDIHSEIDTTDVSQLFKRDVRVPDWLVGYVYALDLICRVVGERFRPLQPQEGLSEFSSDEIDALQDRVIKVRGRWNTYIYQRLNELRAGVKTDSIA